jgi:hypothetical protein
MFCNKNGIPIPKRGIKTIEIDDDHIVLCLDIDRN